MLIGCIMAALWFLTRNNNILSTFQSKKTDPVEFASEHYQPRYFEGEFEQSFAGRTQVQLRLPFGPNPQQKNIIEQKFLDSPEYMKRYQMNLHQRLIQNNQWRLDPIFNGPYNSYQDPHQPIDRLKQIEDFSNTGCKEYTEENFT